VPSLSSKKTRSTPSSAQKALAKPTDLFPDADKRDPLIKHGLDATAYAQQVNDGRILANVYTRLACKRHLDDLEKSKAQAYPYRFDLQLAGRICAWLEMLPNIDMPGCPNLELAPPQKFCYGSIFGWVRKSDVRRRFIRAYISKARKNCKTTELAGVGLYMLGLDGEQGAQVYNGANNLRQAEILFKAARTMVERRPELFERLGIEKRGEKRLYAPRTNSFWAMLCRAPGDGGGASCFIQDEYHEATSDILSETIVPGQIHRSQPLDLKITTAGVLIGGACHRYEQQMQKVLEGSIQRERTFAIMYSLDTKPYDDPFGKAQPPDDWTDIRWAPKANPMWGITIYADKYKESLDEAIQEPYKRSSFMTKHENIWCNTADGFYDMQRWASCHDITSKIEDFAGEDCVIGIDLASKLDLCALVGVFRREWGGEDHYHIFCHSYLPSSVANRPENTDYRTWAEGGWLKVTDGDLTDYGFILRDLFDAASTYNVREVDFDQRESGFLLQEFEKVHGAVPLFEIPQNTPTLSEPMKWLQSLVVSGRLHHDGNPLLSWAISNVVAKPDHNENVFPRKANDALKIDPHSALLNAMVRARDVLGSPAVPAADEVEVW
jgi:phage terminase large subunit-like protein